MKNKVVSSAIWYTVGNILNKGIAFLTVPIFTRILSKAEFGYYSNYSTWVGLFASVMPLSLASSLATAKYDYGEKYDRYVNSILLLSNIVCVIVGVIIAFFFGYVESLLSLEKKYIVLMWTYLFFTPAFLIFMERNRLEYKYKQVLIISLLTSTLSTLSSVIFTLVCENKVFGRIFGYQVPIILVYAFIFLTFIKSISYPDFSHWKYGLTISLPLVFHTLGTVVLNSSDRLMIKRFCGDEDMAYYSVAYTVSMIVYIVVYSTNDSIYPWVVDCVYQNNASKMKRWISKFYDFYFFLLNLLILISPEILIVVGGYDYESAKYVMPPVIGSYLFILFQIMYNNVLRTRKMTFVIAMTTFVAAIVNVILNYLLIPICGYIAAAYTTIFSYILIFFIVTTTIKRLGLTQYFPVKKMLVMSLVEALAISGVTILYALPLLRYSIVLFYILFFIFYTYKNKDILLQVLGKNR